MNPYQFVDKLRSIDYLYSGQKYQECIPQLQYIHCNLNFSFLMKNSPKYHPSTLHTALSYLFSWLNSTNPAIVRITNDIIGSILSVNSCISPELLIKEAKSAIKNSKIVQHTGIFLPYIASLMYILPPEDQLRLYPVALQIIKQSTPRYFPIVPTNLWKVLENTMKNDDIEQLINQFIDLPDIPNFLVTLSLKDPKYFIPRIFEKMPLKSISSFLFNLPPGHTFPTIDLIARVVESIIIPDRSDRQEAFNVLSLLLYYMAWDISVEEEAALHGVWPEVESQIESSKTSSENYASLLRLYTAAALRKLIPLTNPLKYVKIDSIEEDIIISSINTLFRITLSYEENETPKELVDNFFTKIESISHVRQTQYFSYLIDLFSKHFSSIRKIDENRALTLAKYLINPLPLDIYSAPHVLKILNSLNFNEIRNVGTSPEIIVASYSRFNNEQIFTDLQKLVNRFDLHISPRLFEWFNNCAHFSMKLCQDFSINFLLEILYDKMVGLSGLWHVFQMIMERPNFQHRIFLSPMIWLLSAISQQFGFDIKSDVTSFGIPSELLQEEFIKDFLAQSSISNIAHPWVDLQNLPLFMKNSGQVFVYTPIGVLVFHLISAITSIINNYEVSSEGDLMELLQLKDSEIILLSASLACFSTLFSNIGCELSSKLFKLYKSGRISTHPKTQEYFIKCADSYITDDMPIGAAILITDFAYNFLGKPELILKRCPKLVNEAVMTSRKSAKLFANILHQPLNPMPTFLEFSQIPEHTEWANICSYVIDAKTWLIESTDAPLIAALPESDNKTKALELLNSSLTNQPKTTKGNETIAISEKHFQLSDVEIPEGIIVHEGESSALYNLTSALWYNEKVSISFDKIEEISLQHSDNLMLVLGFFSRLVDYQPNAEKWSAILIQNLINHPSSVYAILSIAFFIEKTKDYQEIEKFITSVFSLLGIYQSLLQDFYFTKPIYIKKLIRAVVDYRIEHGCTNYQFISAYKGGLQSLSDYIEAQTELPPTDQDPNLKYLLAALVDLTIKPESTENSLTLPIFTRKEGTEIINSNHIMFVFPPKIGPVAEVNPPLAQKIMNSISKLTKHPVFLLQYLMLFKRFGVPISGFPIEMMKMEVPLLYFKDIENRPAETVFEIFYPSQVRAFVRNMKDLKPDDANFAVANIRKELFLNPLMYLDQKCMQVEENPDAAEEMMKKGTSECLREFAEMKENQDVALRYLLRAALNSQNLYFAQNVIKEAVKIIPDDQLGSIICAGSTIKSKNFAAVCVAFREFEREMRKKGNEEVLNLCKIYHNGQNEIFDDQEKSEIFKDLENPQNISAFLHKQF